MNEKKRPGKDAKNGDNRSYSDDNKNNAFKNITDTKALLLLREMYLVDHRHRFPNWPEHYHTAPKFEVRTTNGLTKAIISFLRLKGHHVERTGNEGRIIDSRQVVTDHMGHIKLIGSVQRIKGSGMKGTSDLKAVINGQFVAIEVKNDATRDRQRHGQLIYQQQIEAAGGIYITASSFGKFVNWYYEMFCEGC